VIVIGNSPHEAARQLSGTRAASAHAIIQFDAALMTGARRKRAWILVSRRSCATSRTLSLAISSERVYVSNLWARGNGRCPRRCRGAGAHGTKRVLDRLFGGRLTRGIDGSCFAVTVNMPFSMRRRHVTLAPSIADEDGRCIDFGFVWDMGKRAPVERAHGVIDPVHLQFLWGLPSTQIAGGYDGLPFAIVHGHTPTDGPPCLGVGRIEVDTGA
jgi:hypothetical protein